MTFAFLACALVTSISALVSLGFSSIAVAMAKGAQRTAALYTLARSGALVVISLSSFLGVSPAWLEAAAAAMSLVQAGDGIVGLRIRSLIKTAGPFGTAAVNVAALIYLTLS